MQIRESPKDEPAAAPMLEHRFNDDLLISEHDQELARREYPSIYHVLDHPQLRGEFLKYDAVANRAKLWVHRIGLAAVLLTVFALIGSALAPLMHQIPGAPSWVSTGLFCAEVGGVFGVIVTAGGVLMAQQKSKWLEARMLTEVLRQWHFQSLICRGKEIEDSCGANMSGKLDNYLADRDLQFQKFLAQWTGSADSHLADLIENPEAGYQLLHDQRSPYAHRSTVLENIFSVYRSMRFKHQANYAAYKLQKSTSKPLSILKWPAAFLQQRTQAVAAFCLLASLACSLIIMVGHVADLGFAHHIGWPAGIIVLLVLTVATRAVQDGLAAPEELQRFNDYAGKIRYLLGRFDASHAAAEKLDLMVEMERAALEELKGFLRAHHEARFVL